MPTDDSLRSLERAVAAAPHDARARARLAVELLRAGRSQEAVRTLALDASLEDELYLELLPTYDQAWASHVERLEKDHAIPGARDVASTVSVGGASPHAAWTDGDHRLMLVDLATGETRVQNKRRAMDLLFADRSLFFVDPDRGVIVELDLATGDEKAERALRGPRQRLLADVSPAGDRLLITGSGLDSIHRWPELDEAPMQIASGLVRPTIHWPTNRILCGAPGQPAVEVATIPDGTIQRTLEVGMQTRRRTSRFEWRGAGRFLLEETEPGLRVYDLVKNERLDLAPEAKLVRRSRLTDDERRVRGVVDRQLFRAVLGSNGGLLRTEKGAKLQEEPRWHPQADLVLVRPATGGAFELRDLGGRVLRRLPLDAEPYDWTPDGKALVVGRPAPNERVLMEVWRARGSESH